jgi:uncharacterized protein (DUF736 family)
VANVALDHDPRLEECADQPEYLSVSDPFPNARHQDVMIDGVEAALDVALDCVGDRRRPEPGRVQELLDPCQRIVAIDSKARDDSPDFRILFGLQEVGAAWKAKTHEAEPREYLSATIDDPMFAEPLRGALFEDGDKLNFVWRRKP